MVKIVTTVSTSKLLNSKEYQGSRNATIGFSSIGEECLAKVWYDLHWTSPIKPVKARVKRIFSVGHSFEEICISELKSIGYFVFRVIDGVQVEMTGAKNEKQEVFIGRTGHEKGKPDGRVLGVIEAPKTEHLLELKTMNQKNFDKISSVGLKDFDNKYYAQVMRLMKAMNLTRTLFIAINKNTCDYYIERVRYDESEARSLIKKEIHVITSDAPLEKAYPKDFYKCEYCQHKGVCQDGDEPEQNCRTCEFCEMENGGRWTCMFGTDEKELSYSEQIAGCKNYKKGWGL